MSPYVLRRRLQEKKKHKPYRKCPNCSGRMHVRFVSIDSGDWLPPQTDGEDVLIKECREGRSGCGLKVQLFVRSGGGTADTYPIQDHS